MSPPTTTWSRDVNLLNSQTIKSRTDTGIVIGVGGQQAKGKQTTTSFRTRPGDSDGGSMKEALDQMIQDNRQKFAKTFDTGHPFSTERVSVVTSSAKLRRVNQNTKTAYYGPVIPREAVVGPDSDRFKPIPAWTPNVWGNKAMRYTVPNMPESNLANTVGEIARDGIPYLLQKSLKDAQKYWKPGSAFNGGSGAGPAVGGDYLNFVFGVEPLVKDIIALCHAVINVDKILQQYRRDSGRIVRRKFFFDTDLQIVKQESFNSEIWVMDTGDPLYGQYVPSSRTHIVSQRIWFKGAYSYYLDPGDTLLGKSARFAQEANKLLGYALTADTLWNLAPWSWLSDWFVNIGDNIAVGAAFQRDNLVLRYGYIMRHTKADVVIQTNGKRINDSLYIPPTFHTFRRERKERVQASPFGFGVSSTSFTAKQWAILAALGMTGGTRQSQ